MLILLPPSEGKATAGTGPAVRLGDLSLPSLLPARRKALKALVDLCKGRKAQAAETLGLTPGQTDAIQRNRSLRTAATLPAAELYTGVLYDNLGLATLSPAARERAAEQILIFSGLWGALRLDDAVPPYRLAMGVNLPPLGPLAAFWRLSLTAALEPLAAEHLVVDMRSTPYAAAWKPPQPNVAAIRVLQERIVNGVAKRSVVSHMAKATRGSVARALITADADPHTPEDLLKTLLDLGHTAERTSSGIDIITTPDTP